MGPGHGGQVAAHVRVAYPSEIDDMEDLRARRAPRPRCPRFVSGWAASGTWGVPTSGSSSKYTRWTEAGLTRGI